MTEEQRVRRSISELPDGPEKEQRRQALIEAVRLVHSGAEAIAEASVRSRRHPSPGGAEMTMKKSSRRSAEETVMASKRREVEVNGILHPVDEYGMFKDDSGRRSRAELFVRNTNHCPEYAQSARELMGACDGDHTTRN